MRVNVTIIDIDRKELDKQIEMYTIVTKQNPYLFMSRATGEALAKQFGLKWNPYNHLECKNLYNGNRIYIDDELMFGEVEIR